jgi:predicted NAD/FAD-dependent oxidoreductase
MDTAIDKFGWEGYINQIREGIRKTMVDDFLNAIPHLISVIGEGNNVILPTVIDSVGHRWGAAFPIKPLVDMDSYIDTAQQLVVCGDYFGTRHGRVEGAFQSGRSAAQKLIRQIMNNESK